MDDLNNLKGRVGEAFVERILYRALYKVSRLGRESQLQHMFKNGKSEFLPDFLVWKAVSSSSDGVPLHRLFCVEVKYRTNVQAFLRRRGSELRSAVGEDWPEVYVILVTDDPDEGRSCFQLLHLRGSDPHTPLTTIDLHEAPGLGISKDLVDEYTELVRQVFSLLRSHAAEMDEPRKPPAKLPVSNGVTAETRSSGEFRV
jgi:hypothetical protein